LRLPAEESHAAEAYNAQIDVVVTIGHRERGPKLLARGARRAQQVSGLGAGHSARAACRLLITRPAFRRTTASVDSLDALLLTYSPCSLGNLIVGATLRKFAGDPNPSDRLSSPA
jgi:hypothetical protein